MALVLAASSMSDPSSAVVVLDSDLGCNTFYLGQVWTGPSRPYRTEISTCIRLQHRPPLLLCLVLFLSTKRDTHTFRYASTLIVGKEP
jgi:hypothetical protein